MERLQTLTITVEEILDRAIRNINDELTWIEEHAGTDQRAVHSRETLRKKREELDENMVFTDNRDRELWAVVGTLPPKYRAVAHLYYYEGYSQEEIAKILGITRTAVQTRMQRARTMLEKELKIP